MTRQHRLAPVSVALVAIAIASSAEPRTGALAAGTAARK